MPRRRDRKASNYRDAEAMRRTLARPTVQTVEFISEKGRTRVNVLMSGKPRTLTYTS